MKNIRKYIMIFVIILLVTMGLFLMDYLNVFYKIGISIGNVNMEFWNIFINAFVVVILYIITYLVIDKKQIKQLDNKKNVAIMLLRETFKECLSDIELMDKEVYRTQAASKINFDDYLNNNVAFQTLADGPFQNHEMILSFAKEGILSSKQLETYLNVKKEFRLFLIMSITFFDKYELVTDKRQEVQNLIGVALQKVEVL